MVTQGIRFAVCIPSRGRGPRVTKLWNGKMSFLDAPGVYLGVDQDHNAGYDFVPQKARLVEFHNRLGSVSYAREQVRKAAMARRGYEAYVLTDDNATFTRESLNNLVQCWYAYQAKMAHSPVIMAGMHGTAGHWDKDKVENAAVVKGLRSYERVSMMFWVIPAELYEQYTHPDDAYGYDDRHLVLWLIQNGVKHFRVCPDAPFAKARYQDGGQGRLGERIQKNLRGTACLMRDFPEYMGLFDPAIPWKTVLKYRDEGLRARLGKNAR